MNDQLQNTSYMSSYQYVINVSGVVFNLLDNGVVVDHVQNRKRTLNPDKPSTNLYDIRINYLYIDAAYMISKLNLTEIKDWQQFIGILKCHQTLKVCFISACLLLPSSQIVSHQNGC